jgi:hypothetical protein
MMKKINLLGMALVKHKQSLMCTGSSYGLNCLQILIAFHAAPYKVIQAILKRCPECVHDISAKDGYSALDIHCARRNIPNEVRKEEIDVSFLKYLQFGSTSLKHERLVWHVSALTHFLTRLPSQFSLGKL